MVEEEVKGKSETWNIVPPIKISGQNLVISLAPNGIIQASFSGSILIKTIDSERGQLVCELVPYSKPKQIQTEISAIVSRPNSQIIPHGYSYYFTEHAKSRAYGRVVSNYEYYKRERGLSFLLVIKKNGNERRYHLGSLLDRTSILREALRAFPQGEFERRGIKMKDMPSGLRHGQKIKACLDILTKEGFYTKNEEKYGERVIERYKRTEKSPETMPETKG